MKLENVQEFIRQEKFGVPSDAKCCRNLGKFKVYSKGHFKSCFDKRPDYTDYWLEDVSAKIYYRINMPRFKNIDEFVRALQGTPVPIEPKELLLLAREIRDEYRKHRKAWLNSTDTARETMLTLLYQNTSGNLSALERLAMRTKNMEIAAEIKEIGKKL